MHPIASTPRSTLKTLQLRLAMPAVASLRMAQAAVKALGASRPFRPANQIRKALQEALHRRSFQSWREIEYAFSLIGISKLSGQLESAYKVRDLTLIRTQLNEIATRRNRIVHEGDLVRHERGGRVRHRLISHKQVQATLDFLDEFVAHMDAVA